MGMLLPTWRQLEATKEKIINLMSGREIHQDIYKERMIDRQQPLLRVNESDSSGVL